MVMAFTIPTRLFILLSLAVCVIAARDLRETSPKTPRVPDAIQVPTGYRLKMILFGKGSQYYKYNGTCWVQFSAKARLYNQEGKQIGHHFYLSQPDALGGQPSWETLPSKGVPHSLVTGVAVAKTVVDENNISWVLLKATQAQDDKDYFGDVAYIQRYNTYGGIAPSSTSVAEIGCVRRTSYSAKYAFYVKEN